MERICRGAKTREINSPLGGVGTVCIGLTGNVRLQTRRRGNQERMRASDCDAPVVPDNGRFSCVAKGSMGCIFELMEGHVSLIVLHGVLPAVRFGVTLWGKHAETWVNSPSSATSRCALNCDLSIWYAQAQPVCAFQVCSARLALHPWRHL